MNLKRKLIAAAAGAAVSPLLIATLPSTAFAHGYVSAPPSRQAQCASGEVECGPIKWEPQSVEGPKGLQSCSGGNESFAELNDDSKGWRVTPVGSSVDFTWTFTARHATSNYEYFINGERVHVVDGNGEQPPSTVTHNVDLSGYSGQQKLLAVWNIADTANAFYACVDINVGAA